MADYRLSAQVISRKAGRSAVASAAYRSASQMRDERTGEMHDFRKKGGLVHEEILAPENAPDWMHDREQLWNAVEAAERRKDAQLAREIQLSLPHELTPEQRLELVRGFVQGQFVDRGMIADLAVHEPGKFGDDRNHHAHIMLTMRELTGEGFGQKNRDWNSREVLEQWREQWAQHQNRDLERYGHTARVDHRSYEDRGIDREPTQHLGPTAHEMEQRGEPSRIGDENRAREERNSDRAQDHAEAARLKLAVDREREQFEVWADRKQSEQRHAQELASLDLSQKHDRQKANLGAELETQYGQHKATIQAELNTVERRLEATGVRKVLRAVLGQTRADMRDRDDLAKTLGSIKTREQQARTALEQRQSADLAKERQRQEENRRKLAEGIEKARQRREDEGWKRLEVADLAAKREQQVEQEKTRKETARKTERPPHDPQKSRSWRDEAKQPRRDFHKPERKQETPGRYQKETQPERFTAPQPKLEPKPPRGASAQPAPSPAAQPRKLQQQRAAEARPEPNAGKDDFWKSFQKAKTQPEPKPERDFWTAVEKSRSKEDSSPRRSDDFWTKRSASEDSGRKSETQNFWDSAAKGSRSSESPSEGRSSLRSSFSPAPGGGGGRGGGGRSGGNSGGNGR